MNKTANTLSLSPAIQNAQMEMMSGPEQSVDKQQVFDNLFTDRAYKSLEARHPYLLDKVVSFKIIDSDVDNGQAVGAFLVKLKEDELLSVPVVLRDNELQSMSFIYDQSMDLFLPLTQDWMKELLKKLTQEEGNVTKPDIQQLNFNNNIMGLSQLPHGRGVNSLIHKLGHIIDIPNIIKNSDKETKEAFLKIFKENKKVASYLLENHEIQKVKEAFVVVEKPKKEEGRIVLADARTPLDMIKKEFGKDHIVMDDIAYRGYHVKDDRETDNKLIVMTDHLNSLENPTKSGPYEVYLSSAKVKPCLVIQDPIILNCSDCHTPMKYRPTNEHGIGENKTYSVLAKNECMLLTPEGDYCIKKNDNIMASPTLEGSLEDSDLYKVVYGDKTPKIPLNKPFIFIKKNKNSYIATSPITVKTKVVDKDGSIKCTSNYGENTIIYTDKYKGNSIYFTHNSNTIIVPSDFKILPVKESIPSDVILGSMKTILSFINTNLLERDGKPITIVKDESNNYGIESNRPVTKHKAVIKIAEDFNVNAKEAEMVLDKMDNSGLKIMTTYVMPKSEKIAQPLDALAGANPQQGGMMPQQGGMMPQQGGMMPQQGMHPQQGGMMPQQGMPPMGPIPGMPSPDMLMGQGADLAQQLQDEGLFDTSAIMGLTQISKLENLFPKYIPHLITALDSIARMLLNFWMNARDIKEEIGLSQYDNLENKLDNLYKNLSDLLLDLHSKMDIFST